jgi:hypothetical protein
MTNFSDKSCTENQNMPFMFKNVLPKIVPFMSYVENYSRAEQATGDDITWATRFACWITKASDTHA